MWIRRVLDWVVLVDLLPAALFVFTFVTPQSIRWDSIVLAPLTIVFGPLPFFLLPQVLWTVSARVLSRFIAVKWPRPARRCGNALFVMAAGFSTISSPWYFTFFNWANALFMLALALAYGFFRPWHRWVALNDNPAPAHTPPPPPASTP